MKVYNKTMGGITAEIMRHEVDFLAGLLSGYVRDNKHDDHVPTFNHLAQEFLHASEATDDEDRLILQITSHIKEIDILFVDDDDYGEVAFALADLLNNNRDIFKRVIEILHGLYGDFHCRDGQFFCKKRGGGK